MRAAVLFFFLLYAVQAQKPNRGVSNEELTNRAAAFERLQNDLGTALAHVSRLDEADRSRLDQANLVLGQAIADRRGQHKVNKKKILAALKDIQAVADKGVFPESDHKVLAEDCRRAEAAAKEPTSVRFIYTGKPGQPI